MSDEKKSEKMPFDPTMSFSFFGSWFNTLERVKEIQGAEAAYNFFEAIANYSMYHEDPHFDDKPALYMLWPMTEKEIDISLKRRGANFSSKETEERRQQVIAIYSENPSLSVRAIAEMTGIPKSAVGRIIKSLSADSISEKDADVEEEKDVETENETDIEKENESEIEADEETEIDKEQEIEKEIDTMGLGRDGTVGQSEIDPLMCSLSEWENLPDEVRKEFTILDRIQARIASEDWLKLEILKSEINPSLYAPIDRINNDRVIRAREKWRAAYAAWQQSIADESVVLILDKYLSTHTETPAEKQWGDRYGRIIDGWDAEKQEPIIMYSATKEFPQGTRHNIASIPVTYYRVEEAIAAVEEEMSLFDAIEIDRPWTRYQDGDDLPF